MAKELQQALARARKTLEQLERTVQTLAAQMSYLSAWEGYVAQMEKELQTKEPYLSSDDYRKQLEDELQKADLPFEGEFPIYRIPPFKLELAFEEKTVRLSFGQATIDKTGLFEPHSLSQWVKKHCISFTNRSFNAERFFRDLLSAYKVANRLAYAKANGNKVLWGRAVTLRNIYDLLTLRAEARREYKEEHFVFDLARLRDKGTTFKEYSVEFGYTRVKEGNFVVPDLRSGREEQFTTLTIHFRKEELR